MKKIIILLICFTAIRSSIAQNPAPEQAKKPEQIFINAKIFTVATSPIQSGFIHIRNGKIVNLGEMNDFRADQSISTTDLKGQYIFPGLISPYNTLGLEENEAIRPTHDYEELGEIKPNVRALIAYNTDSEVIPTVRGNGILITQATPVGGLIPGRSSIMHTDGWNWEDAVLKSDDGIWINFPGYFKNEFNSETYQLEKIRAKNFETQRNHLLTFVQEALAYKRDRLEGANLKYLTFSSHIQKGGKLFWTFEDDKSAFEILDWIHKFGFTKNSVLVGAPRSNFLIEKIAESHLSVLIPATHRLPENADADIWEAYTLPKRLIDKGIEVGMFYNASFWRTRNLAFAAGSAVAYGLSQEDALKMITLNNAKILGIDSQVGSLEIGKDATFVISKGNIMDMKEALVIAAFIQGNPVNLDDKQKRLYKKYQFKYFEK